MDLLKTFFLISFLFFVMSSCAKLQYVIEQGSGQLAIFNKARPNEVVIKDIRISSEHRKKIYT